MLSVGDMAWTTFGMNHVVVSLITVSFLSPVNCAKLYSVCDRLPNDRSFYDLETADLDGNNRTLQEFSGNVTLVVNLATF